SKWIRSAPAASTASTSSPRRAKSAERIEGAISGLSIASTFIVSSLVAASAGQPIISRSFRRRRAPAPGVGLRAPLRLVLHRGLGRRRSRVEHERERQRRDEHGRERPQRRRIASALRTGGLGEPADRRRTQELTGAEA